MAGKEYEYRVTAENAGGESDPSDVSAPIKAKPLKGQHRHRLDVVFAGQYLGLFFLYGRLMHRKDRTPQHY